MGGRVCGWGYAIEGFRRVFWLLVCRLIGGWANSFYSSILKLLYSCSDSTAPIWLLLSYSLSICLIHDYFPSLHLLNYSDSTQSHTLSSTSLSHTSCPYPNCSLSFTISSLNSFPTSLPQTFAFFTRHSHSHSPCSHS